MLTLHTHADINASREAVWDLLQDFSNIERWWPKGEGMKIDRVVVEGSGIGQIRHIYNAGYAAAVSEKLDTLEPDNFRYQLSIVGDPPAGLVTYQATGQLTLTGDKSCRLTYDSEFTTEKGREDEATQFLSGAYQLMFMGLKETAEG